MLKTIGLVIMLVIFVVGSLSCAGTDSVVNKEVTAAPITEEKIDDETTEANNKTVKVDDEITMDTKEIFPSGGELGIVLGNTSQKETVDSEGYPHQAEGYSLWGGTVMAKDENGKELPLPSGISCNAPLIILNGNDYARTFHLFIQSSGIHKSDKWGVFEPFPQEYYSWIMIEDVEPKVGVGSTRKILVTLSIPFNFPSELRGNRYWFRIVVEDWSQTGFIQLAKSQNWLIIFAEQ